MPFPDERTPLFQFQDANGGYERDAHDQFCMLVGVPPSIQAGKRPKVAPKTLYGRATRRRASQNRTYMFTATLSNTLLLSQVVIGAALTALGASESSHILITVFSSLSTVIAGIVAYLKSRGQPMRARMFRDDLDRVVDEIENSEVMWLGISNGVHGYDEIAVDDTVSVRSEVARLTRLYDRAVRSNTMNDPDMYLGTGGTDSGAALRARPPGAPASLPQALVVPPPASAAAPAAVPVAPVAVATDPDESPATAAKPKKDTPPETPKDDSKPAASTETPAAAPSPPSAAPPPADPDASPATAPPKPKSPPPQETPNDVPHDSSIPAPEDSGKPDSTTPSTAPAKEVPDEKPATTTPSTTTPSSDPTTSNGGSSSTPNGPAKKDSDDKLGNDSDAIAGQTNGTIGANNSVTNVTANGPGDESSKPSKT